MKFALCLPLALIAGLLWRTADAQTAPPSAGTAPTPAPRLRLDELIGEATVPDIAVSPSGRFIAYVVVTPKSSTILIVDLQTSEQTPIARMNRSEITKSSDALFTAVYWKTDDRLLFRTSVHPVEGARLDMFGLSSLVTLGDRMFAVNRDGSANVRLLAENRGVAIDGAFNLGEVVSLLPNDPDHIVMIVEGFNGPSLFKVNVRTGSGELLERPDTRVVGWWLGVNGEPVVRIDESSGSFNYARKDAAGTWKRFLKVRKRDLNEQPDYRAIGPTDQVGTYFVIARPPGKDRRGLYRYNIGEATFGDPVIEHPTHDLVAAGASRDGSRVSWYCYDIHVRICDFTDPSLNSHMKSLRRRFGDSSNVLIADISDNENVLLLYVDGSARAPRYFRYTVDTRVIDDLGLVRDALANRALPTAEVVEWTASDGLALSGFLTVPPGARGLKRMPLVVYPHGGPEMRDRMEFDVWVQFFAARGYAVFQPNFRGSDGQGESFAAKGYGEWGRRMQSDITEGLRHLVAQEKVDPARVCIVGASYGGYAALAGAALTPELYRCAVSRAGSSDLREFIDWRRRNWGSDSEGYTYWLRAIGDPKKDAQRLDAASPARQAAAIKADVLLLHGANDFIVPPAQSKLMKKALEKAGRPVELIEFKGEGHSNWSSDNTKHALIAIDRLLWKSIGPGYGSQEAPQALPRTTP